MTTPMTKEWQAIGSQEAVRMVANEFALDIIDAAVKQSDLTITQDDSE